MALLYEEDLMPFFGNPNIQRQGAKARALAAQRDVNTLPDPRTYAAVSGLLGTAPDQMGFSVLNPQYESVMQTARPAFATGTALGVAPLAKVFQAPAMALGRAGERVAERVVPQIMERGGLPANLLQGMSRGTVSPLDVYHGTPHTLPPTARNPLGEFDASKIGTGEGAQAYGFGIYTAEAPATAMEYQKQLGTQMKYKGQKFYDPIVGRKTGTTGNTEIDDYLLSYLGDTGVVRKELLNAAKEMRASKNPQALKEYQTLMSEFRKIRPDVTAANTGNLYKADLPDEMIPKMLDWDKPLSKQKPVMLAIRTEAEQRVRNQLLGDIENNIRASLPKTEIGNDYMAMFSNENVAQNQAVKNQALAKLNKMDLSLLIEKEMQSMKPVDATWEMTGKDFYEMLSKQTGSAKQAAEMLKNQGIPGIKYLDEGSRAKGEGTRNFVTFPGEEQNLRILERNGLLAP